jgi:Protein of unknown function (DUF402)
MQPRVVTFRSVFRGRVNLALAMWLLEETADQVVIATIPGAQCAQLTGPREKVLAQLARGTEEVALIPWHTQRRVWVMPFGVAHAIGTFWNDATGEFLGHYVNLQSPLQRTAIGFDSCDHVLDIVVEPDGTWHWKDEEELAESVELGVFSADEAAAIRAEGDRVIPMLPRLLPTGWESWHADQSWPTLTLHPDWRDVTAVR